MHIELAALLLTMVAMLTTAIWTVAGIRTSSTKLAIEIRHLAESNERLAKAVDGHDNHINNHETRISLLEQRAGMKQRN